MINYIREIADVTGLHINELNNMVGFSSVGGKALIVNNYIKLLSYANERVVLKTKDDELVIEGMNLSIKQMNKNDICLCGDIVRVYFASKVKSYDKME